ncbi:MAG: HEAT repeat domain-containing protein, partial [Candidatus Thorarchaeota archaeon]|nr:HEAT repeat domain-containing protein [Candidatus Thorarchaeota archaeon]
ERYLSRVGEAAIRAMGKIHSPRSKEILLGLLETGRSATRAMAIEALSGQNPEGIVKLLTPYLVDKSRPVSRASVLTLAKTGSEGRDAIRANASVIVKRIGYDKPSRAALTTMLCISDVGQMREVQQYVAKRIEKCARDLRRWSQQGTNRYHSYYWRRREVRSRERLIDYVKLAAFHLKPPFDGNLTKAVMSALILDDEQGGIKRALGENQLAKALTTTQSKDTRHVQTFLSLFR